MFRRLCAVVVSILVVFAFAPVAVAYAPSDGPIFNRPKGKEQARFHIINHVERAISHTHRGATILISTFLMDRRVTADRLIAAHRRGVHVKVIMDDGIDSRPSRRLARVLGKNQKKKSFAVFCHNSCRGTRGQMHSKYYAFSSTGRSRNVVMVSSANLNNGGARLGWNDLVTVTRKPSFYKKFRRIHKQMARDRPVQPPGARHVVHKSGRFTSQFLPKPGVRRATDPVYKAMSRIHCRGVRRGAGRRGRTAVNVSMFWWSGERGMYLARRLLALRRDGCIISVTYGAPSNKVAAVLRRAAWRGRIALYDSREHRNNDGKVDLRVHTKYMLVNGHYGRDRSSWQVITGSANWVSGSLTGGDEVMLKIASRPAYVRYIANYNDVRQHGARKIGR